MKKIYRQMNKKAFYICLIASVGLLVASFTVPPLGIIHPSVLKGVGELFGFATLAVVADAIGKGSDIKLTKGDTTLTVDNPDVNDDEELER